MNHAFGVAGLTALLAGMAAPHLAAAQLQLPPGWRWVTDAPASVTTGSELAAGEWRFTRMAPGWHVTTRPAAFLYDTAAVATGRYAVESAQVLFPGTATSGYGVFVGGHNLDGPGANYLAFLVRRDGHVSAEQRSGASAATLLPWIRASAVKLAADTNSTVTNTLRVSVDPDSVRFSVNGERVGGVARGDLRLDSNFGFRVGEDLNLHITTLDHTRRLAPVPPPRRPATP